MTVQRLLAVALIFACTTVAWFVLGASVVIRTGESDARLAREVGQLWGGEHNQVAPDAWYEQARVVLEQTGQRGSGGGAPVQVPKTVVDRIPVPMDASRLDVSLALDQRRKGLLWYATYGVSFAGEYRLTNPDAQAHTLLVHFVFPSTEALYDSFTFRVNGQEVPPRADLSQGIIARVDLAPGGEATVKVSYRSRGLGTWGYSFTSSGVARVRDLVMHVKTDCDGIDFPAGAISPTRKERDGKGWKLEWGFESLITGQRIAIALPNRLNPGPLAARITFFAPVSLLFFVTVVLVLGVLSGRSLHPVNYFFLSAAFFAFHLLLAYLVDHVNIHAACFIASATSIALVVSYLRLVAGMSFALLQAGLAQLVFLVLFSYAFFFEGYTGLTVTVGSIITLFVLMQATAHINWSEVFARKPPSMHPGDARG
jgi:Inner membrane protein CreD